MNKLVKAMTLCTDENGDLNGVDPATGRAYAVVPLDGSKPSDTLIVDALRLLKEAVSEVVEASASMGEEFASVVEAMARSHGATLLAMTHTVFNGGSFVVGNDEINELYYLTHAIWQLVQTVEKQRNEVDRARRFHEEGLYTRRYLEVLHES